MRAALLVGVVLLAACATPRQVQYEHDARLIEGLETKGHLLMLDESVREEREQRRDLQARVDGVEYALYGAWDRPECAGYSPDAQRRFCHRVPPKADK